MASDDLILLVQIIAKLLENHGWKRSVTDPVFTKMFQGCNHEHQAITRLICKDGKDGCRPGVILLGIFESEGRNVLGSSMTIVLYDSHPLISRRVVGYINQAEKLIGESYSVGLYRKYGMSSEWRHSVSK